eukprot:12024353-Ditylum_brightwellii.AAC.1
MEEEENSEEDEDDNGSLDETIISRQGTSSQPVDLTGDEETPTPPPLRRTTWGRQMALEEIESWQIKYIVLATENYESQENLENLIGIEIDDLIVFVAKHDPDTKYFHQATKESDTPHFVEAVVKEINEHSKRGHWELIPIEQVVISVLQHICVQGFVRIQRSHLLQ